MTRRRFRPLRYTVPSMILVVGTMLMAFYYINESRMTERRLRDDAESDLRLMAAFTAGDLEIAFRTGEPREARAAIERLAGNRQVDVALLATGTGRILYSTQARLAGTSLDELEDPRLQALFDDALQADDVITRHWQDPDVTAGAFPVSMRTDPSSFLPQETGWLVIRTDLSGLTARYAQELRQRLLPYALALALLSLLLVLFFRATLLRRINRLTIATRKFAKGDFSDRPDIGEGDELSDLAAEFRAMADHLQRHTEELDFLSTHDGLTGLLNRRGFEYHLVNVMAHVRHSGGAYLLCYLDIDGFRVVNDTQGHLAGDSLLRDVAMCLREGLPAGVALARLAGDEFATLLPAPPDGDARGAAQGLQDLVRDFRFEWEDNLYRVTFNIGVVSVDRQSDSAERALSLADAACYAAKEDHHTRIKVWDRAEDELAEHHGEMHWVSRIQSALDGDLFELFAQRIFPARGRGGLRLELLIRMRDRDGALVSPDRFLPAAEHYGLVSQIDRWVVRHAFRYFRRHPSALDELTMCAINLSALSLGDQTLVDLVAEELERPGGLRANQICFEVTETAAVTNLSVASSFMKDLQRLGCHFALDDFGSGVSSFGYLKNLKVESIKIDGLFVRGVLEDTTDLAIVRSINDIAHEMGMSTVAEFVESKALAKEMRRIGVDYLQGNGLARAQPLPRVLAHAVRERARSKS